MSQIQPIEVYDRTFSPVRRDGLVVFYRDQNQQIPALRSTLSISLAEPTKTSKLYKARIRLTIPAGELDVNGDPTGRVSHLNSFEISTIYDASSKYAERLELISTLRALVTNQVFADIAEELSPLY